MPLTKLGNPGRIYLTIVRNEDAAILGLDFVVLLGLKEVGRADGKDQITGHTSYGCS